VKAHIDDEGNIIDHDDEGLLIYSKARCPVGKVVTRITSITDEFLAKNGISWEDTITKIDEYFKDETVKQKYDGLTAFQFEFYMWPEIQLELAAEAFFFAYEDKLTNSERKDFREQHISAKIEKIKELLLKNA
jgi:hypothetical protein